MKKVSLWRITAYNLSLMAWTFLISFFCMPLLFMPRYNRFLGYAWGDVAYFLLRKICSINFTVRGMENFRSSKVIVASKHQSALDIIALMNIFRTPAFVLKRELTWIPFWGLYFARMGMIVINRAKGREALAPMVAKSQEALHENRVVLIFPEGTRIPPGEKSRMHPGVAVMYDALKVPILPVALNTGHYYPKNKWQKFKGTAVIEFLPLIPAGLSMREAMNQLEAKIETATNKLSEETK